MISFHTFFVWALLLIVHTLNSSPLQVISLGCNALLVPFQQLLEGPMEVFLAFFLSLKQNLITYRSSKVSDYILKFISCDNQALVGCIPIPVLAVHLSLKSLE